MIIIGIDPGIARCGYGLINTDSPQPFMTCGIITTASILCLEDRLHLLGQDLEVIIQAHQPDHAVVEKIFFGNNRKTAMVTAQARGVILYMLRHHHVPIESLTPLQIKSRLTGYGGADKTQVQNIVTRRLSLTTAPQPDDAADALAAALSAS